MKFSIAYAKNFRQNLTWYLEEQQALEKARVEQLKLKELESAKAEAEERRKSLFLDIKEEPYISKLPFEYKRTQKTLIVRPDLSAQLRQTQSETESRKKTLLNLSTPEEDSLKIVQIQLRALESRIRKQDLRP